MNNIYLVLHMDINVVLNLGQNFNFKLVLTSNLKVDMKIYKL